MRQDGIFQQRLDRGAALGRIASLVSALQTVAHAEPSDYKPETAPGSGPWSTTGYCPYAASGARPRQPTDFLHLQGMLSSRRLPPIPACGEHDSRSETGRRTIPCPSARSGPCRGHAHWPEMVHAGTLVTLKPFWNQSPMKAFKQLALALVTAAILAPGMALAKTNASQPNAGVSSQMQSLIKEFRATARQLQQIKQKAIQSNPELQAKHEQFREKLKNAMAEAGYNVASNLKRLKEISKRLKNSKVSKTKRQALAQELRRMQRNMLQARKQVLQMSAIQSARQELHQATLAAMRKQSKRTEELINHMKELRDKLLAMRKRATAQPGGGSGK